MSARNFSRFSVKHDLLILREVLRVNPYEHAYKWHEIYGAFVKSNCINNDYWRLMCTARTVKKHVNHLVKLFVKGEWDTLRKFGNEIEVAEKMWLLESIRQLIKDTKEMKNKLIKSSGSIENTETDIMECESSEGTLENEELNNSITSVKIKIENYSSIDETEPLNYYTRLTTHPPSMSSTPTRDQVEKSAFESSSQNSIVTPPSPSISPTLSRDQDEKSTFEPSSQNSIVTSPSPSISPTLSRDQVEKSTFGQVLKYLESIKNDIAIIKANQDKMDKRLEKFEKLLANTSKKPVFYNLPKDFPLPVTTEDDLISLNTKIKEDKKFQSTLVNHFHLYAHGNTISTYMLNVSKKLMWKEVAMLYSRLGRKGKKCFEELSDVFNVILAAASLKFPNARREELAEKFGRVLAHAPEWDGREAKNQMNNFF